MTNEIFNNEILSTVNFNRMGKFKIELCRAVTDNQTFTTMICNSIIGVMTPLAGDETVRGTFYATGEALKKYIRKTKQVLGLWNFNVVIEIDDNKKYVINNTIPGFMTLCEAHE